MASNQDQYNQKNAEIIAKFEDLLKKASGFIYLNGEKVGAAAGADSLDQIAVGNASAVRSALYLGSSATKDVVEVFNSAGEVVFHSDWYLMDVVDFIEIPSGIPTRSNQYDAGAVASNVAIAKTLNRVWTTAGQGGAPVTFKDAVRIDGGRAIVSYVRAGDYGNSKGYSYLQAMPNYLIVVDTSKLPNNFG